MNIRRLGWAGVELEAEDGELAVIDLLRDAAMREYIGEPHTPLPGPSRPGAAALALVTHLHGDHTDPDAIAAALADDGVLLRPAPDTGAFLEVAATLEAEQRLVELGVRQRIVNVWETVEVGPFRATAVPAVDGFGDPQVSWIVEADGRVYHAGDTLFHGSWWRARMRAGAIDVAFLPVNGPLVAPPPPARVAAQRGPDPRRGRRRRAAARRPRGGADPLRHHPQPAGLRPGEDPAGAFPREAAALA